jgi:hypothetical protein
MDNEEPIVWHEPILDHYWDILEAEIDRMRQLDRVADIRGIKILNVEMKKERIAALVAICLSGNVKISTPLVTFENATSAKRALYGCQSCWTLVPICKNSTFITIGWIIWIRPVAFQGH